jgi:hypothetical protein
VKEGRKEGGGREDGGKKVKGRKAGRREERNLLQEVLVEGRRRTRVSVFDLQFAGVLDSV